MSMVDGFTCAGAVAHHGLNIIPGPLLTGQTRHKYGEGPFARLVMPTLPGKPGLYLWERDGVVVYVGHAARWWSDTVVDLCAPEWAFAVDAIAVLGLAAVLIVRSNARRRRGARR